MPPYYDVYVLSSERSSRAAHRFLVAFAPNGEPSSSEYWFPQYSERPAVILQSANEAIQHCIQYPSEPQSLYFSNRGGSPAYAMLFFTSDGGLILGLSVEEESESHVALDRLKEHAGSDIGYVTFESSPCATAAEFRETARRANG